MTQNKGYTEEIILSNKKLTQDQIEWLEGLSKRFSWFSVCDIILIREGCNPQNNTTDITLTANSCYNIFNRCGEPSVEHTKDMGFDLIDNFISKKISKIDIENVDKAPKGDLAVIEEDYESMVALAQFMEKIGDKKQAIEIYTRICLTFTEKSVYFAPIIEKLSK